MKKFNLIERNLIISTSDTDFDNFLEDYNRYNVDFFNVHKNFNGLSNDVSHFVVA